MVLLHLQGLVPACLKHYQQGGVINILLADVAREGTSNQSPVELIFYRGHPRHCPESPVPDRALGLLLMFRCNQPPSRKGSPAPSQLPLTLDLFLSGSRVSYACLVGPYDPENLRRSLDRSQANYYSYCRWRRAKGTSNSGDIGRP